MQKQKTYPRILFYHEGNEESTRSLKKDFYHEGHGGHEVFLRDVLEPLMNTNGHELIIRATLNEEVFGIRVYSWFSPCERLQKKFVTKLLLDSLIYMICVVVCAKILVLIGFCGYC